MYRTAYHKLAEHDKRVVRTALGYTPSIRDSKKFVVKLIGVEHSILGKSAMTTPEVYRVYMYEHDSEYIGYSTVEDHVTHWRRRGDSRYDEWKTVSK